VNYVNFLNNISMSRFLSTKLYSLITGGLLFAFGFFGFAFRDFFNVPDSYLLAGLILGFWGIVAGVSKK